MAEDVVAGLVPPVGQERREAGRVPVRSALPVTAVAEAVPVEFVHGMGRVDASGRVLDREVLRALGWRPGQPLAMRAVPGSVVLWPDPLAVHGVSPRSCVVLPAAVRAGSGLRCGDRVLLVADPGREVLVVHALVVVEAALRPVHTGLVGGDPR
ncbi:hypothetical protein [Saccharopolyspora sp. CA-218241]|uniref:hypothetical protein n=1 Tax=Saccharopolyspora sp. CA-218241 TaxID=3240027 RepID=UPI003D9597DF